MSGFQTVPYDPWNQAWLANPQIVSLVAGASAGMATEAVLFPIDAVKTRAQSSAGLDWKWLKSRVPFGIYRGCGVSLAGNVPASAIFFCSYEVFKEGLGGEANEGTVTVRHAFVLALASASAEATASFVRVPVDMLKQRLQMGYQNVSLLQTGMSSAMAAYKVTLMRDLCHNGMQFPMYECLKVVVGRHCSPTGQCTPLQSAFCGGIAGFVSAALSTPFDVLKTRLNLAGFEASCPQGQSALHQEGLSTAQLVRAEASRIYHSRGMRGFFAGGLLRASWMGIGGFIFLGSFEFARKKLTAQRHSAVRVKRRSEILNVNVMLMGAGRMALDSNPDTRRRHVKVSVEASAGSAIAAASHVQSKTLGET